MKCNIQPIGKTPVYFCTLPEYCQVKPEAVIDGPLTGAELLELFFTGDVDGKKWITAMVKAD